MSNDSVPPGVPEATAIAERLRRIPPHHADEAAIGDCERALALLEDTKPSALWRELQLILGHFMLERRTGERALNVARAREAYTAVFQAHGNDARAWEAAACGIANALIADPAADPETFEAAFEVLETVITRMRERHDRQGLAVALGIQARALATAPSGDRDDLLERALVAQREQIAVIGSADEDAAAWGRAHHNLATLYVRRRTDLPSQNTDSAVAALQEALRVRTIELDPVGRARTLRALARVVPNWSGMPSQAEADALAAAFESEADEIAQEQPLAARGPAGWGHLSAQVSALRADLSDVMQRPGPEAAPWLDAAIEGHRVVLQQLPVETMPLQWAEWQAGLGCLLAARGHLGKRDAFDEAYQCFVSALDVVQPEANPRLYRDICARLGAFAHQIGAFDLSMRANANALFSSDALLESAAAPESRRVELADMRGFALFASYAAARTGALDNAVELAEAGRARSLVEMLAARELAASRASDTAREAVASASRSIADLEGEWTAVRADDPHAVMQDMQARLADHLGVDSSLLKMRLTNPDAMRRDFAPEYLRIASALRTARAALRDALATARADDPEALPERLQAADVAAIAGRVGHPLVYVMATTWGGAAVIVPPDAPIASLLLEDINSDVTTALLFGGEDDAGYALGAMEGNRDALAASLPGVIETLAPAVVGPIADWLARHGHERATLIPLGRLGLLPLHAALSGHSPALSYVPSARALARVLTPRDQPTALSFLGVGDPSSASLPFARAEVRSGAQRGHWTRATVLVGDDATRAYVVAAAARSTHVHFACHGLFRASDPPQSALLLTGEERLSLGALLQGEIDMSSVQLAVLSACQTANTDYRTLPDEVLGLPSGLLLAGVPGIVSTMWPVDDRAAALFCQQFYEELLVAEHKAPVAVARAQRWLRDATAEVLQERVTALRASLQEGDDETDAALSDVWRQLVGLDPQDRPFSAPEDWAAFAYVGV